MFSGVENLSIFVGGFLRRKMCQDCSKTPLRRSKTLLRRPSDEECDQDGGQEGQDAIQERFLAQLAVTMVPASFKKTMKFQRFFSVF